MVHLTGNENFPHIITLQEEFGCCPSELGKYTKKRERRNKETQHFTGVAFYKSFIVSAIPRAPSENLPTEKRVEYA